MLFVAVNLYNMQEGEREKTLGAQQVDKDAGC